MAPAHNARGVILEQLGRAGEAVASYDNAIASDPSAIDAFIYRGNALQNLGRLAEALASFDGAIALNPANADSHGKRGNVLIGLGRLEEAVASYDRAVALKPDYHQVLNNRGAALAKLGRLQDALDSYNRAIALNPDDSEAFNNRGQALADLGRIDEALASFERSIALNNGKPEAFNNRGRALAGLRRFDEALASFDRSIALNPKDADAFNNRGNALVDLQRYAEALASYDSAITLDPDSALACFNRGSLLCIMKRFDEAVANFDRAIALKPDLDFALGVRLYAKMHACDWLDFDGQYARLTAALGDGLAASLPFQLLATPASAELQLLCATRYSRDKCAAAKTPLWRGERYRHERIRIAYLSADFHEHATAHLMAGLFEQHDRSRFETIALSFGPAHDGEMRSRLSRAFDRFIDVRTMSDQAVATLVRSLEADIAVDLKGFTQDFRLNIFAHRPAPVQVNYLGYPGTMGSDYIDYLIADRIVVPEDQRQYFSEQVVYVPDSYQVNDGSRRIATTPSRAEAGLPEAGLVFCCFNNSFKITPDVFDVWMRLLRAIDGSVLWLLTGNTIAPGNLRREAVQRGVDPQRLIFAPQLPQAEHLARHRLADLFLDTYYCNAHTTASDALWAGLPVLTCAGATFASRVAASLLTAVGLPELITHSHAHYEALALQLARDPVRLATLKQSLIRQRDSAPLFDTARSTRHIEAAYTKMWERTQGGEPPQSFAVPVSA
jgi:predicted O-linked N-acetylglucosamine transferase (SPINDLY family)